MNHHKEANFTPDRVRLTGNRVLLRPLPKETRSAGGIHLLPQFNDDRMQYEVLAVGPGRKTKNGVLIAPEVSVGNRVLCKMDFDFQHIDPDMKIIDAKHLEMKWDYE